MARWRKCLHSTFRCREEDDRTCLVFLSFWCAWSKQLNNFYSFLSWCVHWSLYAPKFFFPPDISKITSHTLWTCYISHTKCCILIKTLQRIKPPRLWFSAISLMRLGGLRWFRPAEPSALEEWHLCVAAPPHAIFSPIFLDILMELELEPSALSPW